MKKIYSILAFFLLVIGVRSQNVTTLTFSGRDVNDMPVPLNSVLVTNHTQHWQEVLHYPDTVLYLGTTDIHSNELADHISLYQNHPNPFDGTTEFYLQLDEKERVVLEIFDLAGRSITHYSEWLMPGTHAFKAELASPSTYLLSAKMVGDVAVIKMVNQGYGGHNAIEYLGLSSSVAENTLKKGTVKPYHLADEMEYSGTASLNGKIISSEIIKSHLDGSQSVVIPFALSVTDDQPCPGAATVTDADGNTYNTVQIGDQCWMKENLRTTKYADGTSINHGLTTSTTVASWYNPNHSTAIHVLYGLLYNWTAVMRDYSSSSTNPSGVKGICPTGWHVPSDAEWIQLTNYVSRQSQYQCSGTSSNIAKALASTTGWDISSEPCAVGNIPSNNNATGFSAVPAGTYYDSYGNFGYNAFFWSATESSSDLAYCRSLDYNGANVYRFDNNKNEGFSVRCLRDEGGSAQTLPTVTTSSVSNITATSASCGGNVTSDGGATITARGVCWSTSPNPTDDMDKTLDGAGTGLFTSNLTGLIPGTNYYVRAYATNSVGTAYGEERSFTTSSDGLACPGAATVTDADGNTYNTVRIGDQCWMKENLRTTKYSDGTAVQHGNTTSYDIAYWYYPNNNSDNKTTYGLLYNWKAVMRNASSSSANPSNVQGICPTGWHVPSNAEWVQLTDYVGSQSQYQCFDSSYNIAKALASITGWNSSSSSCAVGNNPNANNSTGFSALPAGDFGNFGYHAFFWSATENYDGYVSCLNLDYDRAYVVWNNNGKDVGLSIRCLRDKGGSAQTIPTVTSDSVSDITSTTAICGGNVTSDGGATVIARGVCWSTTPNPTTDNNKTVDGIGVGSFISTITDLVEGTTYYVRAYATNSVGTAYGEEISFTTTNIFTCGTSTVKDIDNNTYNTVQIGEQCWMRENLRTTKYADGTSINQGSTTSTTVAYWYYPNNNSSNKATYGLLYNWKAVMRDYISSATNPSGVQGICPTGWHVPSDAEWTQLTDYVSNQTQYQCESNSRNIAKALASTTGWFSSSESCVVGNNQSANNATGFSALPAGHYHDGTCYDFGYSAIFWSTTEHNDNLTHGIALLYHAANFNFIGITGNSSFSVRCLRDEGGSAQTIPTVTSDSVSDITSTTVICGGNVVSGGGATVTARGVCWSTNNNPTVNDNHTSDGSGIGSFTSVLTGLTSNTTYYVRAYATNEAGTAYGNVLEFTTTAGFNCGDKIYDVEGNDYRTVLIGDRCWMQENMRTHTMPDGREMEALSTTVPNFITDTRYYYEHTDTIVGHVVLYPWGTVNDISSGGQTNQDVEIQGICPAGWHIPTYKQLADMFNVIDPEWNRGTMTTSTGAYTLPSNNKLAIKLGDPNCRWINYGENYANLNTATYCTTENTLGYNWGNHIEDPDANSSGFTATVSGCWKNGSYWYNGDLVLWTACGSSTTGSARTVKIASDCSGIYHQSWSQTAKEGYAVRCQMDIVSVEPTKPTVTTSTVSSITSTTATCGGNVTSDGGATVTARGVCWSMNNNPTVNDNHTSDGSGIGSFTSVLTGLTSNTTYYVRAYATNSVGTAYGEEISFTTTNIFTCGTSTVKDIDDNTYNTVQIGNQCWMKENICSTHAADGSSIPIGNTTSYTMAYRYAPDNNTANVSSYGYLYNYPAALKVCPKGWHLPTNAEFEEMKTYCGQHYSVGGNSEYVGKALAAKSGWNSCSDSFTIGNNQGSNNASGFSALPAGQYYGDYYYFGYIAFFWSTTPEGDYRAYDLVLDFNDKIAELYDDYRYDGFSVRCLKD